VGFYPPKCLERLSEKGCEQRSERGFGSIQRVKWTEKLLFCGLQGHVAGVAESLRTVSEGVFSEIHILDLAYSWFELGGEALSRRRETFKSTLDAVWLDRDAPR
jgi:hypothetical protein